MTYPGELGLSGAWENLELSHKKYVYVYFYIQVYVRCVGNMNNRVDSQKIKDQKKNIVTVNSKWNELLPHKADGWVRMVEI